MSVARAALECALAALLLALLWMCVDAVRARRVPPRDRRLDGARGELAAGRSPDAVPVPGFRYDLGVSRRGRVVVPVTAVDGLKPGMRVALVDTSTTPYLVVTVRVITIRAAVTLPGHAVLHTSLNRQSPTVTTVRGGSPRSPA